MNHVDILAKFLEMFPQYHSTIKAFTPHGYNTILVEFRTGAKSPYVFTYHNDQNWTFGRR